MQSSPETDASLDRALALLRAGGLVAIPTETVYGLAADAENELAVRRVFAVKGRPASHPVIVHLADADALGDWARDIPDAARVLARAFWPGPLTLVLRRTARARDVVTGGQDTVALRVPAHPVARALLLRFGGGLAAPSANRFGRVSPTRAEHVQHDLGPDVDLVLDGGPCLVGIESTIVDLTGIQPVLLRPGGVPEERIAQVLGMPLSRTAPPGTRAPGLLPSHYAPRAGVVLASDATLAAEIAKQTHAGRRFAVLAPKSAALPGSALQLEAPDDAAALARVLYAELRRADEWGAEVVVVRLPSADGIGAAVLDRLARAANPREQTVNHPD